MDIADNAVENGADNVLIEFGLSAKVISSILIADNGTGIADDIIDEVLRAGSRTRHLYGPQSLSRFGIGLKGAGFALARRLTVLTRTEGGLVQRRAIDRDEIERTDNWEQEIRPILETEETIFNDAMRRLPGNGQRETGTVVLLEKIQLQIRDIVRLRTELLRTAGETYGKFLGATAGISRLTVRVDDTQVEAVDPLHRENGETISLLKREKIDFEDGSSAFFTAVSLPHPLSVSDELQRKYRYQQKHQGIYVYRNGRMISGGQTLNLFGRDFHLNAFRAELDYSTDADHHVRVDVAKSTIVLSETAAAKLKPYVNSASRTAATLWREKDVLTKADIEGLFDESNRQIASRSNLLIEAIKNKKVANATRKVKPKRATPATPPTSGESATPEIEQKKTIDYAYLRPQESLSEDVLYRPILDAELGLIVDVNLAHPFSKAVFDVSLGEGKRSLPRRATSAAQQLLYVLGYCEYTMSDEPEDARQFEQFRRYVSMNLRALLTD
jgi:hypothetical protein